MDVISSSHDLASITLKRDELLILNAALNEICNGKDVFEFESRVGADREFVTGFLQRLGSLLDSMDHLPI